MSSETRHAVIAGLVAGTLFGAGPALSGMTDPAVVLGFLDLAGRWNPALAFLMAGALAVPFAGYRRPAPIRAGRFALPTATAIDAPLLGGAALFGVGWGLAAMLLGLALVRFGRSGRAPFPTAMPCPSVKPGAKNG